MIALRQHRGNRPASSGKRRLPGTSGHPGSARGKELLVLKGSGENGKSTLEGPREQCADAATGDAM